MFAVLIPQAHCPSRPPTSSLNRPDSVYILRGHRLDSLRDRSCLSLVRWYDPHHHWHKQPKVRHAKATSTLPIDWHGDARAQVACARSSHHPLSYQRRQERREKVQNPYILFGVSTREIGTAKSVVQDSVASYVRPGRDPVVKKFHH